MSTGVADVHQSHRTTDTTRPGPFLRFRQQGKPYWPHREMVSQPQGRGMAERVEESRRKRMPPCNWVDRASGLLRKYLTRKGADFRRVSPETKVWHDANHCGR